MVRYSSGRSSTSSRRGVRIFHCPQIHDELLRKNPPINEQMLKMMMMQMGQKPSQKKINQMMSAMSKQQTK
ncbi:YneF family protein [Bacillus toyonensis]